MQYLFNEHFKILRYQYRAFITDLGGGEGTERYEVVMMEKKLKKHTHTQEWVYLSWREKIVCTCHGGKK